MRNVLSRYTAWVYDRAQWILGFLLFLLVASGLYISNNLGMNTDTRNMLSEELHWRQLDKQYETLFPNNVDVLVVVIESEVQDLAEITAHRLHQKLLQDKKHFLDSFYIKQESFIQQSSLLYLEADAIENYADKLAEQQTALAILNQQPDMRGIFRLFRLSIEHDNTSELVSLISEVEDSLRARLNNERHFIAWKSMFDEQQQDIYREIILVQPKMDYSNLFPAEAAIQRIRQWQNTLELPVRIKLTGPVGLAYDEFRSVSETNVIAIVAALGLLIIVLYLGLGSLKMMFTIVATLVSGLIFTATFATYTVGELNLISVAFAVLYIGLGVDFAIHYALSYREHCAQCSNSLDALQRAARTTGRTLLFCAVTTALGFFAFLPTDYIGVAELGWIAGGGMFISLLMTLTLIPVFVQYLRIDETDRYGKKSTSLNRCAHWLEHQTKTIILLSVLLTIASISTLGEVTFDNNTIHLQSPKTESVLAYHDLSRQAENSPLYATLLLQGETNARKTFNRLQASALVKEVRWLQSFIPDHQQDKLVLIDDLNLIMGDTLSTQARQAITDNEKFEALTRLSQSLKETDAQQWTSLRETLNQYLSFLDNLKPEKQLQELEQLNVDLSVGIAPLLEQISLSLQADNLEAEDLPEHFSKRWLNNGVYLLEIYPANDLSDDQHMEDFVRALKHMEPDVTGPAVVLVEAGNAVVKAFRQAFIYAFCAIIIVIVFSSGISKDVLYTLIPLILAALFTAASTVLLNIPFNFANIIALPLLLGIGVDSSIHILHRYKLSPERHVLNSSSARAILLSAMTTILSIGNLAFSPHQGTASMGLLLSLGIFVSLICCLIILPALLMQGRSDNS